MTLPLPCLQLQPDPILCRHYIRRSYLGTAHGDPGLEQRGELIGQFRKSPQTFRDRSALGQPFDRLFQGIS